MPRQNRSYKPLIYVFCEGESEQAYTDFLKRKFQKYACIKYPKAQGLFETAQEKFKKDVRCRNEKDVIDEIWFFFDVEAGDIVKWEQRLKIIKQLRKMRRGGRIKVRLLMTSGCIEYWLMLHYKMFAPAIRTTSDKKRILNELKIRKPNYKKGDFDIIAEIAQRYPFAVKNAESTLKNLLTEGMLSMCDDDERNHWLYSQGKTFSNVYEAIVFLEELIGKENNMEKMQ